MRIIVVEINGRPVRIDRSEVTGRMVKDLWRALRCLPRAGDPYTFRWRGSAWRLVLH